MSEPVIVTYAGTASAAANELHRNTAPVYLIRGPSTVSGPVVAPLQAEPRPGPEADPVLLWMASDEAIRYRNHWVALDPADGSLLGPADEMAHLRRWQAKGAVIVFVDPPPEA
jgi:hypothetical protein